MSTPPFRPSSAILYALPTISGKPSALFAVTEYFVIQIIRRVAVNAYQAVVAFAEGRNQRLRAFPEDDKPRIVFPRD